MAERGGMVAVNDSGFGSAELNGDTTGNRLSENSRDNGDDGLWRAHK